MIIGKDKQRQVNLIAENEQLRKDKQQLEKTIERQNKEIERLKKELDIITDAEFTGSDVCKLYGVHKIAENK